MNDIVDTIFIHYKYEVGMSMQAQRIVTQVDSSGHLMQLPLLPPGQSVEVIMLLLESGTPSKPRRKVPAHLKGKIREVGDIMSSAPLSDWSLA